LKLIIRRFTVTTTVEHKGLFSVSILSDTARANGLPSTLRMDVTALPIQAFVYFSLGSFVLALAFYALVAWRQDRGADREFARDKWRRDEEKATDEAQRRQDEKAAALDAEETRQFRIRRDTEEAEIRKQAGGGSGGYIIVDLPEDQRSLFHDLLKGFEDYARLKGYAVAFSVDATFKGRFVFKFTLTDPDVIVGNERIRRDLKEYLAKVREGDSLDDMPKILSFEEHELLVATLKNRITFLKSNFDLQTIKTTYLESLLYHIRDQPVLPAPNIVVQTGGSYSAPRYAALNSPQALVGHDNTAQNRIHIAEGYAERREQIKQVDELLARLQREPLSNERNGVERNLANVKEELEDGTSPDASRVVKWLQSAKQLLQTGALGYETVFAAQELFKIFGLG
jgi:hypothetical protein